MNSASTLIFNNFSSMRQEFVPPRSSVVSTSCYQIFGVGTGKTRLCKINLEEEHGEFLDWFGSSGE
jgi:hypothetical protein